MKFYFHPLADKEFEQAVQYYENCQLGLGLNFSREVYSAISRIMKFPNMFGKVVCGLASGCGNEYKVGCAVLAEFIGYIERPSLQLLAVLI